MEAWDIISSREIGNGGIDLIFGIPGQTPGEWMQDPQRAVDLKPRDISTESLTFENDTPLGDKLLAKLLGKESSDEEADFYLQTWDCLRKNGYEHYEISNFCLPTFESVHNSNRWEMQDWIGVGLSACSQYKNRRFANSPSIAQWLQSLEGGHLAHVADEVLSEQMLAEDSIIFGLRMNRGLTFSTYNIGLPPSIFPGWMICFPSWQPKALCKWKTIQFENAPLPTLAS